MKLQELKKETNLLLGKLPAEANWDDLMYHIYVRKKLMPASKTVPPAASTPLTKSENT